MDTQKDKNARFIIDQVIQDIEDLAEYVPRGRRLRLTAKYKGYKQAFIQKEGVHPLIPAPRNALNEVREAYNEFSDHQRCLNMVNEAYRHNTLPGRNHDIRILQMKLLKQEENLTPYDIQLLRDILNHG